MHLLPFAKVRQYYYDGPVHLQQQGRGYKYFSKGVYYKEEKMFGRNVLNLETRLFSNIKNILPDKNDYILVLNFLL